MAKVWIPKKCDLCKKDFTPRTSNQRYCQNPCTTKEGMTIEEANKAWAVRPKRTKHKNRRDIINFRFSKG